MKSIKRIWIPGYRPFVMGGHVNYTLACDVECEGPVDIGKGLFAYTATAPNGQQVIVDTVSLGVVGNDLEDVRKDVEEGELEVMLKQQIDAKKNYEADRKRGALEVKEPGYFWAKLNMIA